MAPRVLLLLAVAIAALSGHIVDSVTVEDVTCDAESGTCSEDSATTTTTTTQQQQKSDTRSASLAAADKVWEEHYDLLSADGNNTTSGLQNFYGCPVYSDEFGIDADDDATTTSKQQRARPYSKIPTEEVYSLFELAYYFALGREIPLGNETLMKEEREMGSSRTFPPNRGMHVPYEVRWDPTIGRTIHATEFIPEKTKIWTTSHTVSFPRTNGPPNFKYLVSRVLDSDSDPSRKGKKSNKKDSSDDDFEFVIDYEYTNDGKDPEKLEELLREKAKGLLNMELDLNDPETSAIVDASTFTTYRKFIEYLHDHSDETYDWACDALMWSYGSIDDLEDSTVCVNFDAGAMFNDSRESEELETVEGRLCTDEDEWLPPFFLEEALPRGERERSAECLCFGFFAKRDILPGEEFRYDYEYFGNSTDDEFDFDDDDFDVVYIDMDGNEVDIHDGTDYEIINE